VGEKFDADRGQFEEDFACDEVVAGGFFWIDSISAANAPIGNKWLGVEQKSDPATWIERK
jgi:hypothetical protein